MTETAEELAAKHARRELEGMAEKLGIGTIGIGTKVSLAAAIIKATEKASAKEMPKPKVEVKARVKPAIGKKGVFAKRAAIDTQIKENEKAVAVIGTGIKDMQSAMDNKAVEMRKGVKEMHKGINAQIKEIEKAAAKMGIGVKALNKSIEEKTDVLQKGVEEMHSGIKEIQNETANYIQDFYYG
ncbi:MAG: hypothetical protein Q8O41_00625 [Candidatus Methanoperedens sp.]|nr:hypothetical protein [Candidatus Methanoperedens sp.]